MDEPFGFASYTLLLHGRERVLLITNQLLYQLS